MDGPSHRNTNFMWLLIIVATLYSLCFYQIGDLSGNRLLDGMFTVLLGLYICSRPAGNAIDMIFYERQALHRLASEWSSFGWLALNILTLLMGWIVIYLGTAHLTNRVE